MLTTAGAARATESAKLCMTITGRTAGVLPRAIAAAVPSGAVAGAASCPSKAGFHQTTRKAAARPTTTALSKKLANIRVCFNPMSLRA